MLPSPVPKGEGPLRQAQGRLGHPHFGLNSSPGPGPPAISPRESTILGKFKPNDIFIMKAPFMGSLSFATRFSTYVALAAVASTFAGCGSGSSASGGGGGGQSSPDFTLSLSSTSIAITGGATASITATVTGSDGFASVVTLQISGLPKGVASSPTRLQVSPGSPLQINFSAASTITSGTAALNVTGTSGSLTHSAKLNLVVTAEPVGSTKNFRTRYTRTDAATEYGYEPNSRWMVFDPPTNRFFVSDPGGNRVEVLDATTEAMVGSIAVPGAYGIDETPDHSVIYAATQIGDVYAINPVTMQVTKRYVAAQIGPSGFRAFQVRVIADDELALLGGQGGIPWVDGYNSIGVWNPSTNALTAYNNFSHLGAFTLTGDRTLIVLGGLQSPGSFCTLDPATGNVACVNESANSLATTPDGKSILLPDYSTGQVLIYNAKALTQTAAFAVAGDLSSAASMIVSPDSTTLYIDGTGFIYAYDIASGAQIGWLPNLTVEPISSGNNVSGPASQACLQAFDGTGLLAGPMEEGVGFLDTTTLQTGVVGSQFLNDYVVPATGPTAGGTAVEFEILAPSPKMTAAYFRGNPATSISQASGEFEAATPAGTAGPADLYALMADGGMLIVPEGFSYGPTILEVTPNAATADGGGTGIVYGYGFGSTQDNSSIPTNLQITVGGKSAAVTGYAPDAYGLLSPPFNLQAASYTMPPGTADTSATIEVTTQAGTATASGALQYIPALQQFPLAGATLLQGVYDATRDLYYFTDAAEIRVFSRAQGHWLTPIQVPAAPAGTTNRLWGIALSSDGSELAVSDAGAGAIYLIDPSSTGMVQSFPIGQTGWEPGGLAISDAGAIYFGEFVPGTDGNGYSKLDTKTGKFTQLYSSSGDDYTGVSLLRDAISSDNSHVFFNNNGAVFSIDTATDTITYAAVDPGCCYGDYDLTLSADQTTLEATSYLYDMNLNADSYLVLSDRDVLNISYVYGTKLSPDGTLLFQPSTNGIDVFDGRLGTLRERISLPVALSENYDALVSDGTDNVLIAITGVTGNGIAIVDLSSLSEPAPLPYVRTRAHPNFASLPGYDAIARQPQLRRGSAIRTGRQIPITSVKHAANGILLSKSRAATRSEPANH